MARKPVTESLLANNKDYVQDMALMVSDCAKLHKGQEYAELAVFLGYLRALTIVHQSHHWQTAGQNFYSDHILFERLYNETNGEVDTIAEKTVGVGNVALTNYFIQMHHVVKFLESVAKGEAITTESLRAEMMLVIAGEIILETLKQRGNLSSGVEQAIGNVLDLHEGHLYLLQNREDR